MKYSFVYSFNDLLFIFGGANLQFSFSNAKNQREKHTTSYYPLNPQPVYLLISK